MVVLHTGEVPAQRPNRADRQHHIRGCKRLVCSDSGFPADSWFLRSGTHRLGMERIVMRVSVWVEGGTCIEARQDATPVKDAQCLQKVFCLRIPANQSTMWRE